MKYKCHICGEIFEIPSGEEVVCPLCYATGDVIEAIKEELTELPVGDKSAVYNIGYGLYVITCNDGKKDNGMICNTVVQLTSDPVRVLVSINKANYTHDVVKETRLMNVCPISESAPFAVFERFGFKSGRDTDKFDGCTFLRSENELAVPTEHINSYMSLWVESYQEVGTHGIFICLLTESGKLNNEPTMSYAYYHANVKPKKKSTKKTGFVCKICGWEYEGETLPDDIVCPICKHGAADFEKIQS